MRVLGLVQRYGLGILVARRQLLDNGQPAPDFRVDPELGSLHGEGTHVTARVLTFFNNKGGVGTTSLVYHVAWMMSELDYPVLVVDLDPQADLTAAFLDENALEELWDEQDSSSAKTTYQCVEPLTKVGDIREPRLHRLTDRLHLLPGDLALSGFEDLLSTGVAELSGHPESVPLIPSDYGVLAGDAGGAPRGAERKWCWSTSVPAWERSIVPH